MTVIIVHGTHDPEGTWWLETTQGSFAARVDDGLREAGSRPQVWRIGRAHVSQFDDLRPKAEWHWFSGRKDPDFYNREGRFRWSGADLHGPGRLLAGRQLARYLEAVARLGGEEKIHIIAHSHGCNVVKQATCELSSPVALGRIVFLACPHFTSIQADDWPYRLRRDALSRDYSRPVLNLYSPQDTVQTSIAGLIPDLGMMPGLPPVRGLGFEGTPVVKAHRSDQDMAVRDVYEDMPMTYRGGEGIVAHSAVHAPKIGRMLGYWLGQGADVRACKAWQDLGLGALTVDDSC